VEIDINICEVVKKMQFEKILPEGKCLYTYWAEQFSCIYKVVITNNTYYFKYLSVGKGRDREALERKIDQECSALQKLAPVFSSLEDFSIPKLIYSSKEDLLIVTLEVEGVKIQSMVDRYLSRLNFRSSSVESDMVDLFYEIGRGARIIHKSESSSMLSSDIDEIGNYIRNRLFCCGEFSDYERDCVENFIKMRIFEIKGNMSSYEKELIHGDLNMINVLFANGRVGFIDFGDCQFGSKFQDVCCLQLALFHGVSSRVRYSLRRTRKIFAAFCEGCRVDSLHISCDAMYSIILLKNLSIYMRTFSNRMQEQLGSPGSWRLRARFAAQYLLNYIDYKLTKRAILKMCTL